MTEFFYVLGSIIILLGAGWCALILGQGPTQIGAQYAGAVTLGRVLALLPGISVMGSGLIFLAIGGVLHRLDRISSNTAGTALAVERIAGGGVAIGGRREPSL